MKGMQQVLLEKSFWMEDNISLSRANTYVCIQRSVKI